MAGTDPAHAVAQINAIVPARPLHRPVMDSKNHRVSLRERHHFGTRLHARPLLGKHKFTAGEIAARLRQRIATCSGNTCSP